MSVFLVALAAPTVMSDGSTAAPGTALNRIVSDPDWTPDPQHTPNCPLGAALQLLPDDDRQLWAPAQPPPTTVPALTFINRLTVGEQAAIMSAKPMWGVQLAAAGTVDVTDATLSVDFAAAVAGGLLTAPRAAQILNLTVSSP